MADVEHRATVDQPLAADFVERRKGFQTHPAAQLAAGKLVAMSQHPGLGGALLLANPLVKVGVDGGIVGEARRRHEPAAPLGPVDEGPSASRLESASLMVMRVVAKRSLSARSAGSCCPAARCPLPI